MGGVNEYISRANITSRLSPARTGIRRYVAFSQLSVVRSVGAHGPRSVIDYIVVITGGNVNVCRDVRGPDLSLAAHEPADLVPSRHGGRCPRARSRDRGRRVGEGARLVEGLPFRQRH